MCLESWANCANQTWFRHRRERAKQQQKQQEILETSAGRSRAPSFITNPLYSPTQQEDLDMDSLPQPPPYTATNNFAILDHSAFNSPTAMHAAALTRSLSIVAAMQDEDSRLALPKFQLNQEVFSPAQSMDGTQSPIPSSAFSDYGSSECSSAAYTPSDFESDDPFQFDNMSSRPSLSLGREPPSQAPTEPPPDNFHLFAAAIEMNSINYSFVLPSFPPPRVVARRQAEVGSAGSLQVEPNPPFTKSFGQPFQLPSSTPSSRSLESELQNPLMDNSLASRRRRPDSLRSKSYMDPHSDKEAQSGRPAVPTLRRINTEDANLGRVSRSPIVSPGLCCPDTAATIRPRTACSTTRPISDGPLTPISPPSPEDDKNTTMTPITSVQYVVEHDEMSPPVTPLKGTMSGMVNPYFALYSPESSGGCCSTGDMFEYEHFAFSMPMSTTGSMVSIASSGTWGEDPWGMF